MSKRKTTEGQEQERLALNVDEEQLAALQLVPQNLHPNLKCLEPLLESIRKAYSGTIPPHKRSLPVNQSLYDALYVYEKMKLICSNRLGKQPISSEPLRWRKPCSLTSKIMIHHTSSISNLIKWNHDGVCQHTLVSENLLSIRYSES